MSETISTAQTVPPSPDQGPEFKVCAPWLAYEDPAEMLAIVSAIPDGIRLANFPGHTEGVDCWCRPTVTFEVDVMIVNHKDLSRGDFDS
jgi:hypothetical protein